MSTLPTRSANSASPRPVTSGFTAGLKTDDFAALCELVRSL